ncbi:glutamate carboxypeptidase [Acidipila sp. EB88]|nr:M28 family metallopeptidase [Acidipila sp. EB88]RRA49879.1 glutamate carboxypeptidase [Acidipila sp. EB88]
MPAAPQTVFGFHDFAAQQAKWDRDFLAVPDAKLAGEALKTLTAEPHVAGSPEDYKTAQYVAAKFKAAGLDTEVVKYTAWLNHPGEQHLTVLGKDGKVLLQGPTPEHVSSDPFQDDPRVLPGFNSSSASGDVTAPVVYANYGTPADFARLDELGISVRGKLVLVRYGTNYRGVKAFVAQEHGAAGVLIYSDPADDGYARGDKYPDGPYRPDTGVQRGSIQYMFQYPGDVTTPGVASTPDLPESKRVAPDKATSQPHIMSLPISYHDAEPILSHLGGPGAPSGFQGALPFHYHVGGTADVTVHLELKEDYAYRTIWDVIGRIPGTDDSTSWVVAGNHRDAWTYGAVDPNSGTAAMLESVHGIGTLLKEGWKPKRTVIFASWDAEEEGLIGSTEWAEQHSEELKQAAAYFNMDVGVSGPEFDSSAVPSLKDFVREVTREVPSPKGGSVYDAWSDAQKHDRGRHANNGFNEQRPGAARSMDAVHIGDLGSGSDYTPFLQHLGVPATDIGSDGPYGVYHSVFDNYAWFTRFADPTFVYEQQQARVFGLEVLHMADADVLPYDYVTYAREIQEYLAAAKTRSQDLGLALDTAAADAAAQKMLTAADAAHAKQASAPANGNAALNTALRAAEADLLSARGLPNRDWYKHTIYAPGQYTGYAAVVIPGVNEALDAKQARVAQEQLDIITGALNRCAATLEAAAR